MLEAGTMLPILLLNTCAHAPLLAPTRAGGVYTCAARPASAATLFQQRRRQRQRLWLNCACCRLSKGTRYRH